MVIAVECESNNRFYLEAINLFVAKYTELTFLFKELFLSQNIVAFLSARNMRIFIL